MSYVAIWLQACLHWRCAYFQTLSWNDTIFVVDWDILYKLCGSANKWSKGFVLSGKIWWQFFSCNKTCSKYHTRSTTTPKCTLTQRLVCEGKCNWLLYLNLSYKIWFARRSFGGDKSSEVSRRFGNIYNWGTALHRLTVRLNSKVPLYGGSWGQNTSQNPKHVPAESKNTFQRPKHFPESKNTSQNPKTLSRIQKCFKFWELFWILVSVLSLWATVPLPLHYTLFACIPAISHALGESHGCGLKTSISRIKDNSADSPLPFLRLPRRLFSWQFLTSDSQITRAYMVIIPLCIQLNLH